MRLSVALCTYNGVRYLSDQLASLAAQTRLPDELVICDDCSSDSTLNVIQRFAEDAAFPVKLHRNEHRLGSTANFGRAINLCRGEIIILSDQDDVWLSHKLAIVERVFLQSPSAGFLFGDAELVDGALRPLSRRLWEAVRFTRREREAFERGKAFEVLLFRQNVVTGATMAFRSRFRDLLLPFPEGVVHDAWIALLLAAVSDAVMVSDPLIFYRMHVGQQLGLRGSGRGLFHDLLSVRKSTRKYLRAAEIFREAYERLRGVSHQLKTPDTLDHIFSKVQHIEMRANMSGSRLRRIPIVLRELRAGNYHRYSAGWRSIAKDMIFGGVL